MNTILKLTRYVLVVATLILVALQPIKAQEEEPKKVMDIYGFIMMDAGYNFNQIHPDWFDVVRPTKLPSFKK